MKKLVIVLLLIVLCLASCAPNMPSNSGITDDNKPFDSGSLSDNQTNNDTSNSNTELDSSNNESSIVRTILNSFGSPSLPHYLSAETSKIHATTAESIDVNVFLGHPVFNANVPFSEFSLSLDELTNYSFYLAVNCNNTHSVVLSDNIDYISSQYNIKISDVYKDDLYMGSVVQYNGYCTINLGIQLLQDQDYGFVDIQLMLKSTVDESVYVVTNTTLFYSISQEQIIFGLSENPVLHEGDKGAITCGWEYKN